MRLYPERSRSGIAGERVCEMERLRGLGNAAVDYRHVIWSLVRKPGAFARYRYREALFPTRDLPAGLRRPASRGSGPEADVEYVRILHLAASDEPRARSRRRSRALLEAGELTDYAQVKAAALARAGRGSPVSRSRRRTSTAYDAGLRLAGGAA